MLKRHGRPGLSRLLAVRMSVVALAVSSSLLLIFFARYTLDAPVLSRLTLHAQVREVARVMRRGGDPAALALYADYPQAYGFRVIDIVAGQKPEVVAEANIGLLPHLDADNDEFEPGFGPEPGSRAGGKSPGRGKWLLTEYERRGDGVRWIQAVMAGDPAHRWIAAVAGALGNRLLFPILAIVPALTLAVFLATRRALRPLAEISRHAETLGDPAAAGGRLAPLPGGKLPLEFETVMAAVNRLLAQLDRALTLQKEFTADVAHELRTPLAVLLLELSELPPSPVAERMRAELEGLRSLIDALLRFAEAEEKAARERRPVDVALLARRVSEDLAAVAFKEHKLIEFDAPQGEVWVSGQETLIDVALRNLVDNAIKAAPARSTVAVAVSGEGRITVEDRGPGVPDERKSLIFERFWRTAPSGGKGIGLALVRRIALLHGGDVRVEDRPGGGASFILSLAPDRKAALHEEGGAKGPPRRRLFGAALARPSQS